MMLLINEKSVSHSVECPPSYPTALVEHKCLSTDGRSYVARPGPGGINTEIVASSIIALVAVGQQVGGPVSEFLEFVDCCLNFRRGWIWFPIFVSNI
jgi:hypothetical protein